MKKDGRWHPQKLALVVRISRGEVCRTRLTMIELKK